MKKVSVVFPDKTGYISPEIYGHFSEHIGGVFYGGLWVGRDSDIPNERGFRSDALDALRKIAPPVLRWPGGCFAETYNWRDGIGADRPVRTNWWTAWDGRYESNEVGTHEFFDLCELIGTKAYLAINVTSITPLQAREWIDYCLSPRGSTSLALEREANGHPEPFDIDFIGIGNENWGDGGNMTPDYYALEYRRFATVIKNGCKAFKKTPMLVVGGANGATYEWTRGLAENLRSARSTPIEAMSLHYYCGKAGTATEFTNDDWYTLVGNAERMEEIVERHYAVTKGYCMEHKLGKLIVDEWGCWHPDGSGPSKGYNLFEQQSTMRDAVITALTLNIFNNHCDKVRMANVAQICNNLHCLLLAGDGYLVTTPTYHVFDMMKGHMGGTCLRTIVSDNGDAKEKISVSASEKDGLLTVTLANLSCENDAEIALDMLGADKKPVATTATLLSSADMKDHNTPDMPDKVKPLSITVDAEKAFTLPRASVMTLSISLC